MTSKSFLYDYLIEFEIWNIKNTSSEESPIDLLDSNYRNSVTYSRQCLLLQPWKSAILIAQETLVFLSPFSLQLLTSTMKRLPAIKTQIQR